MSPPSIAQTHDFGHADVSVAFSGGPLRLGPICKDLAGVVVRLRDRVRIAPPALVRSLVSEGRWTARAKSLRCQIDLDGDSAGLKPHILLVPVPAERRNMAPTSNAWQADFIASCVNSVRIVVDGTSQLAGLEVGSLPDGMGVSPPSQSRRQAARERAC